MCHISPCIIFIFSLLVSHLAPGENLPIYVYHDDVPFIIEHEKGLSDQWVRRFNQRKAGIKFELHQIERPLLNKIVESGQPYIILWANQLWFKRRDPQVLSSDVIFWDADTIVSGAGRTIDFNRAEELIGLTVGVRFGHYYADFNPLFKTNKIKRVDAKSSLQNYQRLKSGKIDAFLDSRSTILHMQKKKIFSKSIYVSRNPQDAFSRHVLLSKNYESLLPTINNVIKNMKDTSDWQAQMKSWGLVELVNPFELELRDLNEI